MTQIFSGEECLLHDAGYGFPESPARLERLLEGLSREREVHMAAGHPDLSEVLDGIHSARYLEIFRRAVERGDGLLGSSDNPLTSETWVAARSAASAALAAADWAAAKDSHAFAAVRPPGHHAESKLAMGFCYLNNAAAMAERLLRKHGLERVAVYDFDVHHGNGTQEIFYDRSDVLYASTHQWPFYPGTGSTIETGRGVGDGKTLNVPLPAGTDDEAFLRAVKESVLPALEEHEPQALIVSAGFDAWVNDPLGGMRLSLEGFRDLGRLLALLASRVCSGRLVTVLEGGYDLEALAQLALAYLQGVEEA